MKVNDLNAYIRQQQVIEGARSTREQGPQRVTERRTERVREEVRARETRTTPQQDRVELRGSQMMERVRERMNEIPEVRQERVEALRRQIEEGTYNVEPREVARAMMNELLREIF